MKDNIYSRQANNEESIICNQDTFYYGCEIKRNTNKK